MKRIFLFMTATALTTSPAVAQMNMPGMHMPGMKMSRAPKKTASKKHAQKKRPATKQPVRKSAKSPSKKAAPHVHGAASSMTGMDRPEGETMQNMPGMDMSHEHHMPPTQTPGAESMRDMPGMNMPSGEHAGHDMATMEPTGPLVAPAPAQALQGPENAADAVYGKAAMEASRSFLMTREHGGMTASKLLVDQLETRVRRGRDGYYLNAEAWHGGDIDKLWLKTELEGDYGRNPERAEFQALWSHAVDPWWDLQGGVRLDAEPRTRGRLALGVQGLAPYSIETEATAFVSTKGDVTARFAAEHDVRITQKLIIQPRAELNFSLQDIPSERIGSGMSTAELGLRLRYQLVPNFAPYVGVVYERAIGRSARLLRADKERAHALQFTAGVRTWF